MNVGMITETSRVLTGKPMQDLKLSPMREGVSLHLIVVDLGTAVAFQVFNILFSTFVIGVISLLGLMFNIATIVVLSRQVNKSINIVFLGMVISGLCVDLLSVWYTVTYSIYEANPPNFPFEPLSFIGMTAIIPKMFFVYSTCWLTALVAIIQCLCVVLPFKVGILFTPRRTAILTFGLFIFFVFCYSAAFFRYEFVMVFFPEVNTSLYIMVELSKGAIIDDMMYYLGFVAMPMANMVIVICCTLILVIKVKASVNWRNNAQSGKSFSKANRSASRIDSSTKEGRLTKMIIAITTVFIVCNMPNNIIIMARMFKPEFSERGKYQFVFTLIHGMMYILETFNSSLNVLIFYKMSSKFKSEFNKIFHSPFKVETCRPGK
ncbi:neuromedin-U receptor 2-like [Biomphalaria glabrata]|uniref:Neuromedin-U receptor 2-like n=1 Tax=Biomphalaria glabrata TaxID=6526 RepID=A0A9W2Z269_BIOGL|nr:neuromedin-U receptor 2-like [Biomphalaria glabrata]